MKKPKVHYPRVLVSAFEKCLILEELMCVPISIPSQEINRGKICTTITDKLIRHKDHDQLQPDVRDYYNRMLACGEKKVLNERVYRYIRSVTTTKEATVRLMTNEKNEGIKACLENWITKYFGS